MVRGLLSAPDRTWWICAAAAVRREKGRKGITHKRTRTPHNHPHARYQAGNLAPDAGVCPRLSKSRVHRFWGEINCDLGRGSESWSFLVADTPCSYRITPPLPPLHLATTQDTTPRTGEGGLSRGLGGLDVLRARKRSSERTHIALRMRTTTVRRC